MHIERMHKMQECLTEKAVSEFEKGIENVDTSEMGEVVDMIKDLAEAEYHSIISKAMKKADEEEEEYDKELLRSLKAEYGEESGRRYYDQYRYANGRFAPKGRGTRRGYEEPPYYHMPVNYNDMKSVLPCYHCISVFLSPSHPGYFLTIQQQSRGKYHTKPEKN